jgi:hypothetical protein
VKKLRCESCNRVIPAERLDVLPETRVCVDCAREEYGGSDLELVCEPELLGKPESYKKRVGGVSARLARKRRTS